jgi:7,8-dihydropterin-6-yl-methyl-4-(beta-D-ribofuranosyl)aminobenzene 5'-phosphate synthase
METIDIAPTDSVTVTVITDNYYDAVRRDPPMGKRYRTVPGQAIYAEHGLSYAIETVLEGIHGMFMFDFGLSPQVFMNNLLLLGVDVAATRGLSLSHGHFDHWGGLIDLLKMYGHSIRAGTPFFAGEEAFAHRFSLRPSGDDLYDLGSLDRKEIESSEKITVIDVKDPVEIIKGTWLTGSIERVTSYERVPPTLFIMREDSIEEDDFRGELAAVCNVKGKGLVVISGCAHAGIVNTVCHAQKITGIDKVHVVMGGFHFVNADPEIIEKTIADINAIGPDYIIPMHCTGFEAVTAFRDAMPEQFILNTAGTRYSFGP